MAEDRVTTWVSLQRKVWLSDEGMRAELICLENASGDSIAQWPIDFEDLAAAIQVTIELQAAELPKGAHRFRLVAYGDKNKQKQLNELPQTIRGRNNEASQAANDAITLQRSTAMALSNAEHALNLQQRLLESVEHRLSEMTENFGATYERWITSSGENFDQKLRFLEFESKQQRNQQIIEALIPVMGIVIEKYAGKFLGGADMSAFKKLLAPEEPPPPAPEPAPEPPVQQGPPNEPTVEPDNAPHSSVPEPQQRSVPQHAEARGEGNGKRTTRERSRKAPRATQAARRTTKRGKTKSK
jgi:hypothetical protein